MSTRGTWLESKYGTPLSRCSVCGVAGWDDFYYCPNCGSKMKDDAPEPVVARWIDGACSICGGWTDIVESKDYEYCPHCGAKMEATK